MITKSLGARGISTFAFYRPVRLLLARDSSGGSVGNARLLFVWFSSSPLQLFSTGNRSSVGTVDTRVQNSLSWKLIVHAVCKVHQMKEKSSN